MLRQARIYPQPGLSTEVIPKLQRKGDQRINVQPHRAHSKQIHLLLWKLFRMLANRIKHRRKTNNQHEVSGEALVPQKSRRIQREDQQTKTDNSEQQKTGGS